MQSDEILKDLIYSTLCVSNPQEGVKKISAMQGFPEIIYILLDHIAVENFRKKKFYDIERVPVPSRLDEWVYKHLVTNEQFSKYLDRYRGERV